MTDQDKIDPTVAKLLRQVLADSEESAAHRLIKHNPSHSVGSPSSVFFVSTLPIDHPLYNRNHGWEILDEDKGNLTDTHDKPFMRHHAI